MNETQEETKGEKEKAEVEGRERRKEDRCSETLLDSLACSWPSLTHPAAGYVVTCQPSLEPQLDLLSLRFTLAQMHCSMTAQA
jgi:hypothetical protein